MRVAVLSLAAVLVGGCVFSLDDVQPSPPGSGGSAQATSGTDAASAGPVTVGSGAAGAAGGASSASTGAGPGGGGSGGAPPMQSGCSDGYRDAYTSESMFPEIAGCAGAFEIAGASTPAQGSCVAAGDDTANVSGAMCAAANLCAQGWHVCVDIADLVSHAPSGECPTDVSGDAFWLTRQTQNAAGNSCNPPEGNNLIGCGQGIGDDVSGGSYQCAPLVRRLRLTDCGDAATTPPWYCPSDSSESSVVQKTGPEKGGVLCCKDP